MAQYLRKAVVEMKAYTPGEQINNAIKLNTNECAWGPAEAVLKAVAAATPDQLRLYPSPMADRVREAAADVFKVPTSQVLVGNGSDDCLTVVMRSFLSPGEKCACPWPTYSLYDTLATIQGVDISHTDWLDEPDPLLAKRGVTSTGGVPGYNLPISALLASGAKVVFVATPNNPSATLVPLEQLDLLAAELSMRWVIYEDKYGRSRALRLGDTDNYLFPVTMISRRREAANLESVEFIYDKAYSSIEARLPPRPYQ